MVAGEASEDAGCLLLTRQAVEHARRGVDAGVRTRRGRGEDHEVDDRRRCAQAGQREHRDEGRFLGAHLIPRRHHHDGRERRHVEEHDAHGDGVHGLREGMVRIVGLGDGRTHHFDANEREKGDLEAAEEAGESGREEAAMAPQVRDRGRGSLGIDGAHRNHGETDDDQRNDRDDLDEREPELRLAEGLDRHRVEGEEQQGRRADGNPRRQVRPPEVRVAGNRNHVRDAGDHPARPVRPPRHEASPRADQIARNVREGRVLVVGEQQLTQGAHEQEEHRANDHVNQQDRGARDGNRLTRAHEQARADRATNGNQLNVAVFQRALKLFAALLMVAVFDFLTGHRCSFRLLPPHLGRFARSLHALAKRLTLQRYRTGTLMTESRSPHDRRGAFKLGLPYDAEFDAFDGPHRGARRRPLPGFLPERLDPGLGARRA